MDSQISPRNEAFPTWTSSCRPSSGILRWNGWSTGGCTTIPAALMAELGSHQLDAASIFLNKVQPIACFGYGGKNFYGVKGIGSPEQQTDDRDIDDHVYMTFEFRVETMQKTRMMSAS